MKYLFDACVVIDILKNQKDAITFLSNISEQACLSVITIAEIYAGIRNKKEEEQFSFFSQYFTIIPVDTHIAKKAGLLKKDFFPSHHADIPDCLIAATAIQHELEIATRNTKHFPMIKGIQKPY